MDSTRLTPHQLRDLAATTERHRAYYQKLMERMRSLGFPHDEPLLAAARRAYEASSGITITAATTANKLDDPPRPSSEDLSAHWGCGGNRPSP